MKNKEQPSHVPLPHSLRKHIRKRKAEIREKHGEDSDEYRDLLAWIEEQREEKAQKIA